MSRQEIADETIADELDGGTVELRPSREAINERLDKFVASALTDLSRSYIQQLIDAGRVRVDGVLRRAAFKVTPGEVITVDVPPPVAVEARPEAIPLDIVYEDDDVIVLNKPAGMVVHPAPGHAGGTLVNALLFHAPEISIAGSNRPGIVHRLDKETSGLMVVAKTDRARNSLVRQWQERSVRKGYVALASGVVEPNAGTIDAPIGRDPIHGQRMAAIAGGRPSITHFDIVERFAASTLLDVTIETGRTHQIRVHLAFIGHPVVGDTLYNRSRRPREPAVSRQFLHAAHLGFALPDGREVTFDAPLPPELAEVLVRLRRDQAGDG
jgi:23S rRNA pseudouridine1911/1915/1917 synthase